AARAQWAISLRPPRRGLFPPAGHNARFLSPVLPLRPRRRQGQSVAQTARGALRHLSVPIALFPVAHLARKVAGLGRAAAGRLCLLPAPLAAVVACHARLAPS